MYTKQPTKSKINVKIKGINIQDSKHSKMFNNRLIFEKMKCKKKFLTYLRKKEIDFIL